MQQWIVRNLEADGFQLYTGIRFSIWWKGHLYLSNHEAGLDSINALAQQLHASTLSALSHRLKGVFGLFVWDRSEATWQISVDNSGLYRVFFDTLGHVCTSFFEIAAVRGAVPAALSTDALVEFLLHGCVYAPRTLLPGIRRVPAKAVLRIREIQGAGAVDVERKWFPAPDLSRPFAAVLDAYAADLERSLVGKPVSIDLTGGFDSRLVACLLRARGLGQEAAMTGEPASIDAALATAVANVLDLPMHVQRQNIDRLDDELATLSVDTDGLVDVAKVHRDWQAARARLERGITVLAHGGGGELLKDFYFHHEFPFYGRRPASLERLYDLRIVPMPLADAHLTPAARCWVRDSRARLIQRLKSYRAPFNHETCDRAFFGLRLPEFFGGHFSTYINMGLDVVAPLMDRDVVMAAIALSPWSRLMEGQHRRLIESLNARVAAMPTANGYSASCRPTLLARDLVGFATNEARRVVNKLGQRHLGRAPFPRAGALDTDAPGFADRMRQLPTFRSALAKLQERGIYAPGLDPMAVRTHEVGRILTLGLCFDRLGQAQHTARRSSSRLAAGSIARAS